MDAIQVVKPKKKNIVYNNIKYKCRKVRVDLSGNIKRWFCCYDTNCCARAVEFNSIFNITCDHSCIFIPLYDPRPRIMVSSIPSFALNPHDLHNFKILFDSIPNSKWNYLTGGNEKRLHLGNSLYDSSKPYSTILSCIESSFSSFKIWISTLYPKIRFFKFDVLKSLPNAPSQYSGNNNLHLDYDSKYQKLPYDEQPISFLVGVTKFGLIYIDSDIPSNDESLFIHQKIAFNQCAIFTGRCWHAGDENDTDEIQYRIFGYGVSRFSHIPHRAVFFPRNFNK
jgi:hypothetical protein